MDRLRRLMHVPYDAARFAVLSSTRSWREQHHPEIPTQPVYKVFANVLLDELLLAMMPRPDFALSHEDLSRWSAELNEALAVLEANDCLEEPALFHRTPPPIDELIRKPGSLGRIRYDVLEFESGYQTLPDFPGTQRWQSLTANQHVSAYLLQHGDGPRPWLLNLHPFGSGRPFDLVFMRSLRLHREYGYNVLHPVFPLHGSRHLNPVNLATTILSYDLINTIHFISQGIWDTRRLLGWVRSQNPTSISLHGISLGAYAGAVLTGLEELDRAVLGVGAVDLPAAKDFVLSESEHETIAAYGLIGESAAALFRVVSPAALGCRVPPEGRFVYGGVGDRFAPGGTYELWKVWEKPSVHWHAGGHVSGIMAPSVWRYVFDALGGEGSERRSDGATGGRPGRRTASSR